ncbi:MAG: RDD family protein [Chloroflexota bacterium]
MQIYAGFWLRLVAIIIDGFILGIAGAVVGGVFGSGVSTDLLTFLLGWMYFAVMESSPQQATLGKQALGLVVTDVNGMQLTFGRATGRYFAKVLSVITLFVGYIVAGFTAKKQALHDLVAATLVIKKDAQSYVQLQQM